MGEVLREVNPGTRSIAMLIDGDNAQPSLIEHVLAETHNTVWSQLGAYVATGPHIS